jgi:hypothetical protein
LAEVQINHKEILAQLAVRLDACVNVYSFSDPSVVQEYKSLISLNSDPGTGRLIHRTLTSDELYSGYTAHKPDTVTAACLRKIGFFLYKIATRKQHAYCVAMETEFCMSTCKIRPEVGEKRKVLKKKSYVLKFCFTFSCVLHEKMALFSHPVRNVTFGSAVRFTGPAGVPPVIKCG